jgi:hypothetical protein
MPRWRLLQGQHHPKVARVIVNRRLHAILLSDLEKAPKEHDGS